MSRSWFSRAVFGAKTPGQAVIIAAIALPFIVAFVLLVVEVSERWLEVAMLEDALQQASRSAVQTLDYAAMARNENLVRGVPAGGCQDVSTKEPGDCDAIVTIAATFFTANLANVRGIATNATNPSDGDSVAEIVARTRWTILPRGGSCAYSNGASRTVPAQPLICAEVRPVMRGIVGWGAFTPLITASDTLDAVRAP